MRAAVVTMRVDVSLAQHLQDVGQWGVRVFDVSHQRNAGYLSGLKRSLQALHVARSSDRLAQVDLDTHDHRFIFYGRFRGQLRIHPIEVHQRAWQHRSSHDADVNQSDDARDRWGDYKFTEIGHCRIAGRSGVHYRSDTTAQAIVIGIRPDAHAFEYVRVNIDETGRDDSIFRRNNFQSALFGNTLRDFRDLAVLDRHVHCRVQIL